MDPYAELGVPRDADVAAVKRAYRAKAQRAHPDKGGAPASFQVVQAAYDVLSDPERRKRFDETGDGKAAQDPKEGARMELARMVLAMIEQVPDLEHTDLVAMMRQAVQAAIAQVRKNRAAAERKIARHEQALERFKRKDSGTGVIEQVITAQIAAVRASLPAFDQALAAYEVVLEEIAAYRYQVDEVTWPGGMQAAQTAAFGSFFNQGTQR